MPSRKTRQKKRSSARGKHGASSRAPQSSASGQTSGQSTPQQSGTTESTPKTKKSKHPVSSREVRALNRWADSSSYSESSFSDSSESLHNYRSSRASGGNSHKGVQDSYNTPGKKNKTPEVPLTQREQRAQRRESLRQRNSAAAKSQRRSSTDSSGDNSDMSAQQPKWREDQVLVICPGSQTTMAQLGCSELTVPAHRLPTRVFKDQNTNEYRPFHTYKRRKSDKKPCTDGTKDDADDDWEYVEDRDSVEGAIYPLQGGRIVNMPAFLAFLDYVHGLLTATFHNTPIVLMTSPQWTRPDSEAIARYIFEKTKTPSLCLLHSAIAAQYGLKYPNMTIVDIGYEKVDVTCLYDSNIVSHKNLGFPTPTRDISGGEVFTQKLLSLLQNQGFNYDMAEQLKRSSICEVLPYSTDTPDLMDLPSDTQSTSIPVAQSGTGAEASQTMETAKPATVNDGSAENGEFKEAVEGVLDVANIVTSGNMREFLAKREKEKAEKVKAKKQGKGQESETTGSKPVRLPNSKRVFNTFHYEDLEHEDVQVPVSNNSGTTTSANDEGQNGEAAASMETAPASEAAKVETKPGENGQAKTESASESAKTVTERRTKRVRRDIEVGLERFLFADRAEINRITDTIFHTIQSIDDIYKRSACWDNIVFVGNGSRLRGLKENIMQTLTARHLISPSTATIFTSELPSNMATPSGTGSQTPTGSFTGQLPTTSSVNPLLQAATTASLGVPGQPHAPGSHAGDGSGHHSHGQTPMSIKLLPLPNYLADWTKNGFEEAMFLGSLVCARMAFCIHTFDASTADAQRYMSLSRVEFNESGPRAVRTHSMLGD